MISLSRVYIYTKEKETRTRIEHKKESTSSITFKIMLPWPMLTKLKHIESKNTHALYGNCLWEPSEYRRKQPPQQLLHTLLNPPIHGLEWRQQEKTTNKTCNIHKYPALIIVYLINEDQAISIQDITQKLYHHSRGKSHKGALVRSTFLNIIHSTNGAVNMPHNYSLHPSFTCIL